MPPATRVRPYKDFLTPALHRRFSRAAVTLLGLCYVEAVLIGDWESLLWSWFPFGSAGIRTGLLFICAFSIFILRVAQLHVGIRTTKSGFQTFREYAFKYQTVQTAGWYIFSAWLFAEVYLFSTPRSANIAWITAANNNERPRLNERPIYLMTYFIGLAFLQAAFHLWHDYDRIDIPINKVKKAESTSDKDAAERSPAAKFWMDLPFLALSSLQRATVAAVIMPFIYTMFIRQTAWSYTLMFAKMMWSLPRSSALPAIRPFHMNVLCRSVAAGFLLTMMWEVGNAAFSIYVAQEPLKNERPITYESRDPNGSLLTGLRGKKLQTRAFASWELVYIARRYQGRRKALFEEIDRTGGSTWLQILVLCLQIIKDVDTRTLEYFVPTPAAQQGIKNDQPADPGLPKLVAPAQEGDIFLASPPPKTAKDFFSQYVSDAARKKGQHPSPNSLVNRGEKLLVQARSTLLKPEQPNALTPGGIWATFGAYIRPFLQSPFGWPFRQDYRSRMAAIVLGGPYGDVGVIVDAIDILTQLSVCSLKEDLYGNVQKDVATIIKTFTETASTLEAAKMKLGVHWTDVEKKQQSPEVDIILAALRGGLQELLNAFSEYAEDLGITQRDLRLAREIAATPVEEAEEKRGNGSVTVNDQASRPPTERTSSARGSVPPTNGRSVQPRQRSEGRNVEMQEVTSSGRDRP